MRRLPTLLLVALIVSVGVSGSPAQVERRVVRLKAERFAFTPSEIVLFDGETVELRIKSDDTMHGFHVSVAGIDVPIPKRGQGEATVLLTAPAPGRYDFDCNRMCGAGHDFMRGTLVVKTRNEGGERR